MSLLSPFQRSLIASIAQRLAGIPGIRGVVPGGSYARGFAGPDADFDLGLYYAEFQSIPIDRIRELAASLNDTPGPVVSGFCAWGKWVNGDAWVTIRGQHLDFIYPGLEDIEQVIADAESGRYELDYPQLPAFGFISATCLGDIDMRVPLQNPDRLIAGLKSQVEIYPEAPRRTIVQEFLRMAESGLAMCARKFAARGDTFGDATALASSGDSGTIAPSRARPLSNAPPPNFTLALSTLSLPLYAPTFLYVRRDAMTFVLIAGFALSNTELVMYFGSFVGLYFEVGHVRKAADDPHFRRFRPADQLRAALPGPFQDQRPSDFEIVILV